MHNLQGLWLRTSQADSGIIKTILNIALQHSKQNLKKKLSNRPIGVHRGTYKIIKSKSKVYLTLTGCGYTIFLNIKLIPC